MKGLTHSCSCLTYCRGMLVSRSLRGGRGSHNSSDVWYVGVHDSAGSWSRAVEVNRSRKLLCCAAFKGLAVI
jgi:hypothetical protein